VGIRPSSPPPRHRSWRRASTAGRPLSTEELTAVLTRRWHTDGLTSSTDEFTESVAIATIARITGGNFRLVDRLLSQVQRIQQINHLDTITPEVVEAAREALLIGR
jgi:Holliday junction resolvasome RuvABC ATP-dependent DNA helicase subunit